MLLDKRSLLLAVGDLRGTPCPLSPNLSGPGPITSNHTEFSHFDLVF